MAKVSVEKIKIKIGKTEVALSPEEAAELKDILNDLLGHPEVEYVPGAPIVIPYPYPVYRRPWRYWDYDWTYGSTGFPADTETGTITYSLTGSSS